MKTLNLNKIKLGDVVVAVTPNDWNVGIVVQKDPPWLLLHDGKVMDLYPFHALRKATEAEKLWFFSQLGNIRR